LVEIIKISWQILLEIIKISWQILVEIMKNIGKNNQKSIENKVEII